MYFLSKLFQATGLTFIVIGFIVSFPNLMDRKLLGVGIMMFLIGWIIQSFLLKK